MKVISIVSQKGGSGKTTIATSLAVQGVLEGLSTLLIDIDPQGSSYKWGQRRLNQEPPLDEPAVVSAQPIALPSIIKNARDQGAELVIIDTAPHSQTEARKACEVADLVLIPCRPSIHDLDAVEDTVNTAKIANVLALVILNQVHPNSPKQFEDVKGALTSAYGARVMDTLYLASRGEFVHSATTGRTANETEPDGKASKEIKALFDDLDLVLGLKEQ